MKGKIKGISPVIATIILIAFAIAAGFIVWKIVAGSAKSTTAISLQVVSVDAKADALGQRIALKLTLKNPGNRVVQVKSITVTYLTGAANPPTVSVTWKPTLPANIPAGALVDISGTANAPQGTTFDDGKQLEIKITYEGPDGTERVETTYATITRMS